MFRQVVSASGPASPVGLLHQTANHWSMASNFSRATPTLCFFNSTAQLSLKVYAKSRDSQSHAAAEAIPRSGNKPPDRLGCAFQTLLVAAKGQIGLYFLI